MAIRLAIQHEACTYTMAPQASVSLCNSCDEFSIVDSDRDLYPATFKKRHCNKSLEADELHSPILPPPEHYNPRPSRSRATNNSQSGLLIPEDFSKRPEALIKRRERKEDDKISSKRRKTRSSEDVEIVSSNDGDENITDSNERRKREIRDHIVDDGTSSAVMQHSEKQSVRSRELKSSEVAEECDRAGKILFEENGGDRIIGLKDEDQNYYSKRKKPTKRNVIVDSDEEEVEDHAEAASEVAEQVNLHDRALPRGEDDNQGVLPDEDTDFDLDNTHPSATTRKKRATKNADLNVWDVPDNIDHNSDGDGKTVFSTKKKKKGRPKKPLTASEDQTLEAKDPEPAVELTKKSRGRPKKKAEEPPPADFPSPDDPLGEDYVTDIANDLAPPESGDATTSIPLESPTATSPPLNSIEHVSPLPPSLEIPPHQVATTPYEHIDKAPDRQSPVGSGKVGLRVGLSKAARIPSLLRIVRK